MNDDIEPITPDWVERMLQHFEKPHVGVVGAKLLFQSMKIQHAGVVLIHAKPDHVRFKYPRDDDGYYFSTCAVRNFSAVTGAIMMTRTSLFKQLGGYTEALPINFNDVDYCLKANALVTRRSTSRKRNLFTMSQCHGYETSILARSNSSKNNGLISQPIPTTTRPCSRTVAPIMKSSHRSG